MDVYMYVHVNACVSGYVCLRATISSYISEGRATIRCSNMVLIDFCGSTIYTDQLTACRGISGFVKILHMSAKQSVCSSVLASNWAHA